MILCHPNNFSSPVVRVRRRQTSGLLSGGTRSHQLRQKKWRRPKVSPAEMERFLEFNNQSNKMAAVKAEVSSRKVPWIEGYGSYVRGDINVIHEADLPVRYWFYVFTHSSDIELVIKPFREASKENSMDKRLMCLMKRNSVTINLMDMELHKSLPRRLVVIKAPDWPHLVSALADLEQTFPEMMRFASFPVIMDTDTNRYPSAINDNS